MGIDPLWIWVGFGCAFILLIFLQRPEALLWFLLLTRNFLDIFRDTRIVSIGRTIHFNPAQLVGTGFILTVVVIILANKISVFDSRIKRVFVWLLVISGASVLYSSAPAIGAADWLRLLSNFLIYVIAFWAIKDERSIYRVVMVIIISSILPIVMGLHQVTLYGFRTFRIGYTGFRVYGSTQTPTAYASFLSLYISLGIALLCYTKSKSRQLMLGIWVAAMVAISLTTFSRNAWVRISVAVVVIALLERRWKLLFAFAIATVAVMIYFPSISERISYPSLFGEKATLIDRLSIWRASLQSFLSGNIAGLGLGSSYTRFGQPPHNAYVRLLLETGVMGFGLFVSLMVLIAKRTFFVYRALLEPGHRAIALWAFITSVTWFISNLTDAQFFSSAIHWYSFSVIALSECVYRLESNACQTLSVKK